MLYVAHFELVFRRPVHFRFFHGPAIYAMLLDRLGNPPEFPSWTAPWDLEWGRLHWEAGQRYRFGLVQRADARPSVQAWARLLRRPPRTRFGRTPGAPLGGGFRLVEVFDLVAGEPLRAGRAPLPLGLPRLAAAARPLREATEVTLRFRTPLRIHRGRGRQRRRLVMDEFEADPVRLLDRVARRCREWFPDLPLPAAPPSGLEVLDNTLLRCDVHYQDKRIPGSVGALRIGFPRGVGDWALPLLLGGLLGIGKTTNMGQGHYVVEGHPVLPGLPPARATTLLAAASEPAILGRAARAVREGGRAAGVDGVDLDAFLDDLPVAEGRLTRAFHDGRWRPDPMLGLLARRPDGRYRPLAIPTMRDRHAQRCVLELLAPAADELLEDASFAYRAGLSRRAAHRAIQRARDEGWQWVLESDIRSFFDRVAWDDLEARLRALYAGDPLVEVLMGWVRAPVVFGGRELPRDRGLPQGAVISPLLANLVLDAFDHALANEGLRLVRYADDFVVLCRSEEEARRALPVVEEALERLDLETRPDRTRVRSFDQGFRFLGAVFCRSLVVDAPRRSGRRGGPAFIDDWDALLSDATALRAVAESAGWAARIQAPHPSEPERTAGPWRRATPPGSPGPLPVYVVERGATLVGRKRGFQVEREGEHPRMVPWGDVRGIVLLGGHRVRPGFLERAARAGLPVHFLRSDGRPQASLLPRGAPLVHPATRAQWRWREGPPGPVLEVARLLVEAKIHNTRLLLRRQAGIDAEEPLRRLGQMAREALNAESFERLRGLEGSAAHAWFSTWSRLVPGALPWPGRTGRHAEDPVNALLNLLYTLLHRRCIVACMAAGLDPWCGVLHQGGDRYPALASDLQEPFRFLVDRTVLRLLHRREVGPDDFVRSEKGPWRVRIRDPAVRRCIEAWESSLAATVTLADGERRSYDRHLFRQARVLSEHVQGLRAAFRPFRMRW